MTECIYTASANLILEAEDHIARIGFVLTTDQRMEAIAVLDFKGREHALDEAIIRLFRDREQAGLVLGFSVFHDRMIQLDHITAIVTL